jgi:essential nuclear protein 1
MRRHLFENNGTLPQPIFFALQEGMKAHSGFFMNGFVYPLCDSNSCTVQEAMILASVIEKTKMLTISPGLAIMHIADLPMTLPLCILVLALFKKDMFITQRITTNTASKYFCAHENDAMLPLVWYQALLPFIKM